MKWTLVSAVPHNLGSNVRWDEQWHAKIALKNTNDRNLQEIPWLR